MTSLENNITKAWQQQSWWLWLLLPLMLLYWFGSSVHRWLYRVGIKKAYVANIPVLVIGNITVGGSGKTPLLIALVNYLQQKNIQVGVISRGYGASADLSQSRLVAINDLPSDVGDEPCLIKQRTNAIVCVGKNRAESIALIQQHYPKTQLIICDDGLQHYKLQHDMAWIVYDAKRGLGNNMLLPVGFLREWSTRLAQQKPNELVIHHGDNSQTYHMKLQPQALQPLFSEKNSLLTLKNTQKIHAVTGIGYPTRFFNTLRHMGYDIIEHAFPDHYQFTWQDMSFNDDLPVIVTSKDAVKIVCLDQHPIAACIWVLPVEAVLSDACYNVLDKQLSHWQL